MSSSGLLSIVGIGPGHDEHMTPAALKAIQEAEYIVGYTTYIALVRHYLNGKQVTRTGMTEEISRAQNAVEVAASGKKVALISSGDSGVYGMAGLVFEVLREKGWTRGQSPEIKLIPGITAANSCASLVGAPLIHDTCRISLSDLLTPWSFIEKRIECAAQGDFVICLYNPASGRRQRQIMRATQIIRQYRSGETPVALIKSAYRKQQNVVLSDLDHYLDFEIGMNTTVIIGSSATFIYEGYMVTPRGHRNKYRLNDGSILDGQRRAQSLNCEGSIEKSYRAESLDPVKAEFPKLKITPIPGVFMRTSTEFYPEEGVTHSDVSEDSSVSDALNALNTLKGIQYNNLTKNLNPEKSIISYSSGFVARMSGALVLKSSDQYFLIGELKEPCSFEEFGFKTPGLLLDQVTSLEVIYPERVNKIHFQIIVDFSGITGAHELFQRLAIYRNSSISERLTSLIKESSSQVIIEGQEYFDARWLSVLPLEVWNIVRNEVLKCR